MNLIQVLLSALLLIILATYFTRLRSQLRDRVLVLFTGISIFSLLMFPDVSTQVANIFGVGRGVDFLFYLAHAGSAFIAIVLYSKVRQQSEQIAELTRQIALKTARFAPEDTHTN